MISSVPASIRVIDEGRSASGARIASGDLYERYYEGLYCAGCEAFLHLNELVDGLCSEHHREPEQVAERNWFFRLSRYADKLLELVEGGNLRIEPGERRNEVLGFIRGGLEDFSVSRSRERARNWGIPIPEDPRSGLPQLVGMWRGFVLGFSLEIVGLFDVEGEIV